MNVRFEINESRTVFPDGDRFNDPDVGKMITKSRQLFSFLCFFLFLSNFFRNTWHTLFLMTVAVIIPAYNATKTLKRTMESLKLQSVAPDEIIVIDDGSFDGTADLARSLGATVIEQENSGPSAARNNGVKAAKSDIIFLLDADDTWAPDKIEKHLAIWKSGHKGPVYDWAQRIRHNGTRGGVGGRRSTTRVTWQELLAPENWTCGSSCSYLREDWLAIGGFQESIRFAEDIEFLVRYSHAYGDAHCILESLTTYWLGITSASNVTIDPKKHLQEFRKSLPFMKRTQEKVLYSAFALHQMMQERGLKFLRVPAEALPFLLTKSKFYRSVILKAMRVLLGNRFTYMVILFCLTSTIFSKGAVILAQCKMFSLLLTFVLIGHRCVNRHQLFILTEGQSRVRFCSRSIYPSGQLLRELDNCSRYVVIPAGQFPMKTAEVCKVLALRPFAKLSESYALDLAEHVV